MIFWAEMFGLSFSGEVGDISKRIFLWIIIRAGLIPFERNLV